MSSVQIFPPYPIFTDIDGDPLQDGYIYIGQSGLDPIASPISTFFDEALTIPAVQPIRTTRGYASNAGAQSQIYVAETSYSILVRNKNSTQVFSSLISPRAFVVAPASSTDNSLPLFNGATGNTLKDSGTVVTAAGRALLDDADATAQRATLGLVLGTDVQPFDADLTALAALATTGIVRRTGASTYVASDIVTLVTPTITGLLTLSGGQIGFPAIQVPSADPNTFDDYEEGSWTPALTFTTPGDLNVVYSVQNGYYTKYAREVSLRFAITTSTFTHSTASGSLLVTGAPFVSTSLANHRGISALTAQGITKATYTMFCARVSTGTTSVDFLASGSGVALAVLAAGDLPSGGSVILQTSLMYIAA